MGRVAPLLHPGLERGEEARPPAGAGRIEFEETPAAVATGYGETMAIYSLER